MNLKKQHSLIKVMLAACMISLINVNLFGYIWANYSPIAFCEECKATRGINGRIVAAGGYYLKAYSDTLLILERIEGADFKGIDYRELGTLMDQANINLQQAVIAAQDIVLWANGTRYNPVVIKKLKYFDYDGFKKENRLNSYIFNLVSLYLKKGDVRGFYSVLEIYLGEIYKDFSLIKKYFDSKTLPNPGILWSLNQQFSHLLLLGQYAALVFHKIK